MSATGDPEEPDRHARARDRAYVVLRHRDYRLLWAGGVVSNFGAQVQRAAVAWHVYQLTGDPLQLGLLGLARFFPLLIFGLIGGVIADRGDRRRTLIVTHVLLLLTSAAFAALTATDSITVWMIYVLTAITAVLSVVANPTRQALIPALVPRQELAGAMTLNILGMQVSQVVGPAAGGLIIGQLGLAWAYGLDTLTFAVVIGAIVLMRARPEPVVLASGGLTAILDGLRFLKRSPILLGVMSVDFLATFFGATTLLMPIFAEEILGVGAEGLGVLLAAPAVGAVAGSTLMSIARLPNRPGLIFLIAVVIYGGAILGFALSTFLPLSLLFLAISGGSDAVGMALRHTIRNLVTPDELRGRIAAAHSTFAMGGPQLGEFNAGLLARFLGASPAVAIGGLGILLTASPTFCLVPGIGRFTLSSANLPPEDSASSATPSQRPTTTKRSEAG